MSEQAVRYRQKQTNHLFHLVLSLVTLGLWLPVWLVVAILNAVRKEPV